MLKRNLKYWLLRSRAELRQFNFLFSPLGRAHECPGYYAHWLAVSVINDLFETGLHFFCSINLMHLTRSSHRTMLKVSSFREASKQERKTDRLEAK